MTRGRSIVVDRDSDEPVYQQIARQIRGLVASGALLPGDALPGVRALASDLGVNLNTVARAYRILEDEGFLTIRDRSGVEVARPRAGAVPGAREALRDELRSLLARLRQTGLTRDEIERLALREIARLAEERRKG
jgi:DNA-binding transcriptional regulator YhcF (GntR family)